MESNPDGGEYYHQVVFYIIYQVRFTPQMPDFLVICGLMLLFLVGSALVSGSEVAFFSLKKKDIVVLKKRHSSRDLVMLQLLEKPRLLLATILIANNFFNVSIIILSFFFFTQYVHIEGQLLQVIINTVLVTFLLVLFGEVIPKVFANSRNVRFARALAPFLSFLLTLFRPMSYLLASTTKFIDRRLENSGEKISMDDIDQAIDITTGEAATEEEVNILKGIIKFGNISVKQIMHSRVDVVALDMAMNYDQIMHIVVESGFSRIPVYSESLDEIEGILYAKDLLEFANESVNFKWQQLIREPFFVPENKKIEDLLQDFRSKRIHLAIVVDEYGGTSGLVTLEDIMEEIIGEINDEFDESQEVIFKKIDDNNYVFEGKTLINDFCKVMDIKPEKFEKVKGESDSLAGLLLEITQRMPAANELVRYDGFVFTVIAVTDTRIEKVKITKVKRSS